MDICEFCQELAFTFCELIWLENRTRFKRMGDFAPPGGIDGRSSRCRFCRLVDDFAAKAFADLTRSFYKNTRFEIAIERSEGTENTFDAMVIISRPGGPNLQMAVWASPGSPAAASGLISCDPPLPSDSCPEAFSLFRSWFANCRETHKDCRYALDGTVIDEDLGPLLPTRVLDLGEPGATDVVLIETEGRRGNYCALSYCWGPPGAQTMTTTRETIGDHLSGISLDSMPKTFQDAVQVTRQISVRYLWIDELCIIQGDVVDWTQESKRMGAIYQGACLVIAASGAPCPKDGCFMSTTRELAPTQLPYFTKAGVENGSFNICAFSWNHYSPSLGPLHSRGWALQESYLARRRLHFMPGGPSWICKHHPYAGLTERNILFDPGTRRTWRSLLSDFSTRELTCKSDRLMAVEGIATEVERGSGDTYNRGVFISEIAAQLLWMSQRMAPESEDLTDIPSWSWASKGVPKLSQIFRYPQPGL